MTALEDRRPVAAETALNSKPGVIADMLCQLLTDNPEIELASIRLIPRQDGGVGIAGRIGELAPRLLGVECPQCHQPAGRPHTEYCTLSPDRAWSDPLTPIRPLCPCMYSTGPVDHIPTCPDWR